MSEAASVNLRARVARFRPSRLLVLDLFTSYGVNLARAAAMLAIVALLGHRTTTGYLAAFLFLRAMIGLLNNLFAGVQPAALAALRLDSSGSPGATASVLRSRGTESLTKDESDARGRTTASEYASRGTQSAASGTPGATADALSYAVLAKRHMVVASEWTALFLGSAGSSVVFLIAVTVSRPWLLLAVRTLMPGSHGSEVSQFITMFTVGLLARLGSDAAGGVLQLAGRLWLDNVLTAAAELIWVALAFSSAHASRSQIFLATGDAYFLSGVIVFFLRWAIAAAFLRRRGESLSSIRFDVLWYFLRVASLLALASLGDFLYAPANYLIINRLLDPILIASYGPALQVDALLLLGVSGIASVLLPRVVALHQRGDFAALRHAYLAAHIVGTLLLLGGAGLFLAFSRPLLNLWLGDVPPGTRAILPFVLIHTVVGGTASIGRSVLLGVGRFRAWTVASLAGGIANVVLGLLFVVVCGWGLRGIVAATIITVTLRNAIWLPWFVLRQLRPPQPL